MFRIAQLLAAGEGRHVAVERTPGENDVARPRLTHAVAGDEVGLGHIAGLVKEGTLRVIWADVQKVLRPYRGLL